MKLDLKELLLKLTQPLKCTEVTLPYTPTCNGLMIVQLRASGTGRVYETYNGTTPGLLDGYNTSGNYLSTVLFCVKGTQVSVLGRSNVQSSSQHYYFIPIVGGVVRRLLSSLTLERGWEV